MQDFIPTCKILKEFMVIVFQIRPTIEYHTLSKAFSDVAEGTVPYTIDQLTILSQVCLHVKIIFMY